MNRFLTGLLLTSALTSTGASPVWAQEQSGLPLVKTSINADAEHAELCLEFNKPVVAQARLASSLKLEKEGKNVALPTSAINGASLCLFPLEHGKDYCLDISNLRLGEDEKFSRRLSFSIPDRPTSLVFAGEHGAFASSDKILTLRGVNLAQVHLEIYRVTDKAAMAHAWQDRAQTSLAPGESIYIAKNKGEKIWQGDLAFTGSANKDEEKKISLHDSVPGLAPGLYLIAASTPKSDDPKILTPQAALWLTKSDFSLRSVRDGDGIHVFASRRDNAAPKSDIHLTAFNKKPEQIAEADGNASGMDVIGLQGDDAGNPDIATVVASDKNGNVGFADIAGLPALSSPPAPGTMQVENAFVLPGSPVGVVLSLAAQHPLPGGASFVHVAQDRVPYADISAPAVGTEAVRLSFPAPPAQDVWNLRWQQQGGALLAEADLRVTANGDAPHLEMTGQREMLNGDLNWSGTVKSVTSAGKPAPVTSGHIGVMWQPLDPASVGWKDYRFGVPAMPSDAVLPAGDFVSDLQGEAQLDLTLPKPPSEHGLYQAVVKAMANADSGVAETAPVILPLRPDNVTAGIKPLATNAHFPQNGMAHFSLIGIGGDLKPRDMGDLSYQLYEEGRNFSWYQEEGRWQYKPEAQLRPIGGGDLSIKADGSSQIEWPVTAGNYRLEILDGNGRILAQTGFSAGWDATANETSPLAVTLPKALQPGREAAAHIHLPEAATVTTVISGAHILKILHETRPKGDTAIAFTPAADWPDDIVVSVTATMPGANLVLQGQSETTLTRSNAGNSAATDTSGLVIWATDDPAALIMRKDSIASLDFAIANNAATNESVRYVFTASPGLKIESGEKGDVRLNGKQSVALPLVVAATTPGVKEIRLEAVSGKNRITRSWTIGVADNNATLKSDDTAKIENKQQILPASKAKTQGTVLLIARRSMDGLPELLTSLLAARPFTTQELSASLEALRLWGDVATQTGLAPDNAVAARRRQQMMHLLLHQNADGGFANWRGGDSSMADTAAALIALGPDTPDMAKAARNMAIAWIKQRLSNSWIDAQERPQRAAGYAALAAADATDAASLHYFSDNSAQEKMPAVAEANMAAAFKHARDPNAAAFWIKKMLDEHPKETGIALLNALAATDALSSDDVHAAMASMIASLRKNGTPDLSEVAQLLRAIASDNADAGKGHVASSHDIRDVNNVLVLRDSEAAVYANSDTQPLYVTFAVPGVRPTHEGAVTRHIYRLNGVEMPPATKPNHGDIYMVELKGSLGGNGQILVQDGGNGLHPLGCPLTEKTQGLGFVPWFTPHDLSDVTACEFSPHRIGAVLSPDTDDHAFSVIYFAMIDAASIGDLPPPRTRALK